MTSKKPYIANGTTSDPREQVMWDIYIKNLAKGVDNAYQAAIEAGYEDSTAKSITLTGWYAERKDKLRRKDILSDSEKLLQKTINYDHVDDEGKIRTDLLRIQTDVAKHITSTLGKDVGYSSRSELTGKDGQDLIPDKQSEEKAQEAIDLYLGRKKNG